MLELQKLPTERIVETPVSERAVFYETLSLARDEQVFNDVVAKANADYGGIEKVAPYFTFDRKMGSRGSNLGLAILASEFLGDVSIPTLREAMALHDLCVLDTDFIVDYGAVLNSEEGLNTDKAESVISRVKGMKLPIIFHPKDLTLKTDGRTYGLRKEPQYLISGEEAQELLRRMNGGSGFRRLNHHRSGWVVSWLDALSYSDSEYRVADFVRGEAARSELLIHEETYIHRNYQMKRKELENKLKELFVAEKEALSSIAHTFHRK